MSLQLFNRRPEKGLWWMTVDCDNLRNLDAPGASPDIINLQYDAQQALVFLFYFYAL
jgi:hypothetical protein